MWLFFAFIAPAFYAVAETLDNFLSNKAFRHPLTLTFYASLFNLVFMPVLFFLNPPVIPPLRTLPIFLALGFVGFGYLIPYYKALKTDDTSVAIAFLAIERIFVPVLAFLIVGEMLAVRQYIGIALIVVSVFSLALHNSKGRFRFSKAVWLITVAALFLAFEGVLLKLLFDEGVTVSTAVIGESALCLVFGVSLLFLKRVRRDVMLSWPLFLKLSPIFLIEEGFTFLGQLTESSAISVTSVSVVKGITMTSPFFLLFYAMAGHTLLPRVFKENLHRKNIHKKLFLFCLLIIGIILIKD
ncbi:MAG: hypothetical protein JWN50_263 [Parcubacteria group bacterium]|nr:hypothetical protein [Parcubacteria group bacterium]